MKQLLWIRDVLIAGGFKKEYYFNLIYRRNLNSGEIHTIAQMTNKCNGSRMTNYEDLSYFEIDTLKAKQGNLNMCEHCK